MSAVQAEIAAIGKLSLQEMRKRWQRTFNCPASTGLSRDMMMRGLAHKIQERAYGGLPQSVKRKLQTLAKQLDVDNGRSFNPGPTLKPGAKLIREWNARTYAVTVLEDGFEYDGRSFGSLSKIAREITGAKWSGPRFFGLKKSTADA
jgi:hypothetical protein